MKTKINFILTLFIIGVLFLPTTIANALTTINSEETLIELFKDKKATINGSHITLTGDINLEEVDTEIEFTDLDITLDLNGHTLTAKKLTLKNKNYTLTSTGNRGTFYLNEILITDNAEISFNNLYFKSDDGYSAYLNFHSDQKVTINNILLEGKIDTNNKNSDINIQDSNIKDINLWSSRNTTIKNTIVKDMLIRDDSISGIKIHNGSIDRLEFLTTYFVDENTINNIVPTDSKVLFESKNIYDEEVATDKINYFLTYNNVKVISKDLTEPTNIINSITPNKNIKLDVTQPTTKEQTIKELQDYLNTKTIKENYSIEVSLITETPLDPTNIKLTIYYLSEEVHSEEIKVEYKKEEILDNTPNTGITVSYNYLPIILTIILSSISLIIINKQYN